ncbi:recombinase family protein [Brevibacillus laterosporus]|uniref:recombinase family protein n=1 Tax=Brevibacillus laterosporus TaxID=1465 RepID=UPI000EB30867|nr:recombinase family protein [Brevibacillus laterosporus]AYK08864.1 recombinase family protein [Brevibacillus laterosporus]
MNTSVVHGYVRVSSKDQNAERQIVKMRELGVSDRFLFVEKQSGKDFDRPQYLAMRDRLRAGDLIYIDALDRLGRDYDGIISEWKYITREIGADIVALENSALFDSRKFKEMGDMGKLMEDQFLALLAYVAEQERKKIRQRQAEGIAIAKAQGKHMGRPSLNLESMAPEKQKEFATLYKAWKDGKITAVSFMKRMELKRTTFYKLIKEYESK